MDSRVLKKLIENYGVAQLESCIRQQLARGENACELIDKDDEVVAALSEAGVVRELMDQGMTFSEALRELGRRIRAVYGKE
jgi:hypothetical protein